ncbi:TATA element modulatory factor-like [Glandiceps talaboti]
MSWFDSAGLTNLAKSALTNAQKSIDKVLDIQDEEDKPSRSTIAAKGTSGKQTDTGRRSPSSRKSTERKSSSRNSSTGDGDSFWSAFLETSTEEENTSPKNLSVKSTASAFTRKGFGLGLAGKVWGAATSGTQEDVGKSEPSAESEVSKEQRDRVLSEDERTKVDDDSVNKSKNIEEQICSTEEGKDEKDSQLVGEGSKEVAEEKDSDSVDGKEISVLDSPECKVEECQDNVVSQEKEESHVAAEKHDEEHIESHDRGSENKQDSHEQITCDVDDQEKDNEKTEEQFEIEVIEKPADVAKDQKTTDTPEEENIQSRDSDEHREKKYEERRGGGQEGDSKSDHSSEGHNTDDQSSSKSDSDFVVISDINGSAPSSTNISGSSPESASPRHYPICPGNGKRSPSDSEFSIISEGKLQESVHLDSSCDTDMTAMLADASINLSQRTSPTDTTTSSDIPKYSSGEEGSLKESADDEEEDDIDEMNKTLTEVIIKSDAVPSADKDESYDKDDVMARSQEDSSASVESVKEAPISGESVEGAEKDESITQQDPADEEKQAVQQEQQHFDPEEAVKSEKLLKKLAEMAEVLQARENQVLTLSKENMDLQESSSILRSQLKQSEEARESELEDLNIVTEEFTQRLSSMEKKFQSVTKERDMLKKEIQITYQQLQDKSNEDRVARLLEEKDEQIEGLMEEGEKLSKQQLQNSNIIKKLRVKEKESENLIKSQKKQLDSLEAEVTHLKEVLDGKEGIDKKQKDGISKLSVAVELQEKQINTLNSELEDAKDKVRSTQSALDASYKEIAELHRTIASKESKIQEAQLSAEMNAKEEIRFALERAQQEARHEQDSLAVQVNDLRMSLSRAEQIYARKEDNLRLEIGDLQQRLQEAEYRNQELSQSVTAATRPLLRQIENLQSTFTTQSNSWERIERSLTERLNEAQTQLASALEKERMVTENSLEMNSRLAALESQVTLLRQEKVKLSAMLEMERTKIESLEEYKNREAVQLDTVRHTYSKAIEDLERDKALLEKQVEMERLKVDTEKKKLLLAQEALKDKEKKMEELSTSVHLKVNSQPETPTLSRSASFTSEPLTSTPILPPLTQGEILEQSMSASMTGSMYENVMSGSATAIIESLQSQVKQRDGEIVQLQVEITQLERTRTAMAEELVNLSNRNEILEDKVEQIPEMQRRLQALEHKHNAVLQMYGEKAEEAEELKLDLQDVKEMYRQQIEELLKSK